MSTYPSAVSTLRHALRGAPLHRLREAIDWVERPWAPHRNDALRALWHAARRGRGSPLAFADVLADEVLALDARDLAYVARRLGLASAGLERVAAELAARVGGRLAATSAPDLVANAVQAALDVARVVLREARPAHGGRHRPRGRRPGHG